MNEKETDWVSENECERETECCNWKVIARRYGIWEWEKDWARSRKVFGRNEWEIGE